MKSLLWFLMLGLVIAPAWGQLIIPKPILDDKSYDFGLIPIGTEVRHTFLIKNPTKEPLKVGKITISCDCTKIVSSPEQIAPGATGQFLAVMNHHNTGFTDVSIFVPTGPKVQDLVTFHMIGVLVAANTGTIPDHGNLISAQDVLKNKNAVLVDIRDARLYSQGHALGAQNVPLFALEARNDLKAQSLVLINDGIADASLFNRMDALKKQGFKDIHLLENGYPGWKLAGGPFYGLRTPTASVIDTLDLGDFYSQQRSPNGWVIVNLDGVSIATVYPQKTLTVTDAQKTKKDLQSILDSTHPTRILFTSSLGNGYDQIQAIVKGLPIPVFYLKGGSLAYTSYIQQQTLALAPKTVKLTPDQAYLASGHATGQVIRGGGCSSCGH